MNPTDLGNYIEVIGKNLQPLADKIGQSVEWTFSLFVKQAYVEAFGGLLLIPVGILCGIFAKKFYLKTLDESEYDAGVFWIPTIALTVFAFVMILVPLYDVIAVVINPEYQAIKLIFDLVKDQTIR